MEKRDIEGKIAGEYFTTGAQAFSGAPEHYRLPTLTICVLVLKNGYTAVGHSNFLYPQEYDAAEGRRIARERAVARIWELEGFPDREAVSHLAQELADFAVQ